MRSMTNCKNCGAPLSRYSCECEYCGTEYGKYDEEYVFNYEEDAISRMLERSILTVNEARRYSGLEDPTDPKTGNVWVRSYY